MNFKDLVHGVKFHVNKKESFTIEDVYAIEEQLRNKIISEIGRKIEDDFAGLETKLETQTKAFEEIKTEADKKAKEFEEFQTKAKTWESKVQEVEKAEKVKTASTLLKGLVVDGAENDAFNAIADKYSELDFSKAETLEAKQALVKPLVEEIVKAKPYMAATKETVTDDKKIITITKKEGGEEKTPSYKDWKSSRENVVHKQ